MGNLALEHAPGLGDPPVVDRNPVARPERNPRQVDQPGFVGQAAAAARLDFDERLPDPPAERRRPLVAAAADGGGELFDQPGRLLAVVRAEGLVDQRPAQR